MRQSVSGLQLLAEIVGTHGLRGDLKVRSHPGNHAALLAATGLFLRQGGVVSECLKVRRATPGRGWVRVSLAGFERIEKVEPFVGAEVLIDPQHLRRAPGEVFWFELEDIEVVDAARGTIGRLEDMFETAAHPIYVVRGDYGEVLIPAVPEFVLGVDPEKGVLRVDVPEGLFPDRL